LKKKLTTQDIAAIAIGSALYAVFGYLTAGLSFLGVGFLPAVVIPAVFAAIFGPWVGGISGAIGIFIRDMLVHGNAPLSLVAGVPPNFILFFLIGYIYTKNINLKHVLTGITLATIGLLTTSIIIFPDMTTLNMVSNTTVIISLTILTTSLAAIAIVSIYWKEWQSYAIGTIIGQITGGLLLSITLWLVSPMFLSYFGTPVTAIMVLPLFIWTIITEIPFILIAGPPIIKIVQKSFPTLQHKNKN